MELMSYLQTNLAESTVIIGLILLIIEVWLLGLSTIVLLALGVSAIVTGGLVWAGIIPETLTAVIAGSGIGAGVLTAILWRPLKRSQKGPRREYNIHSDFIGLVFDLEEQLDATNPVTVKYSGVNWKLVLGPKHRNEVVPAGGSVKVTAVDVGKFMVEPVSENGGDS
ncbi:putative activity regulator of membrane protease YbbK [Grimontia indica]|uniref:Activity regulator of membrane protease YbbK n=1 Tax=Grimontia indica TaxID=1056512 RepID=R1GY66_9GAMM|nr:NfeD family protein [Grimontia indica]EOD80999.1 putative activity regulator of membrane protease YbbK [Grimontia indica]